MLVYGYLQANGIVSLCKVEVLLKCENLVLE